MQLLQHLPTREQRISAIRNAASALAGGGIAVFANEVHGLIHRVRSKPREVSGEGVLFFHPYTLAECVDDLREGGLRPVRMSGCGVLYWTRYSFLARALVKLDVSLSFVPCSATVSKFVVAVGVKGTAP